MSASTPSPASARIHRCSTFPQKVQHRSLTAAFAEVDRARETHGTELHVYACADCGFFHLSKQTGRSGPDASATIGRRVLRSDLPLWTTGSDGKPKQAERDERFTGTDGRSQSRRDAIEAIETALRAHSNPGAVTSLELAGWAGLSTYRTIEALKDSGWVPLGAGRARIWHRRGGEGNAPEPFPAPASAPTLAVVKAEPEWEVIDLNAIKDLTIDQLLRVYKTAGRFLEVRTRER